MYSTKIERYEVSIPSGSAVQDDHLAIGGTSLFLVFVPAAIDGTAITFLTTSSIITGVTTVWSPLYNSAGSEISLVVAAARCVVLDPKVFASLEVIRLRMGTAASPTNQTADRVLQVITRSIA